MEEEKLKKLLSDHYERLNNLHKYVNHIYRKKKEDSKQDAMDWRKQFNMINIKEQKLLIKRLLKLMENGEVFKGDK